MVSGNIEAVRTIQGIKWSIVPVYPVLSIIVSALPAMYSAVLGPPFLHIMVFRSRTASFINAPSTFLGPSGKYSKYPFRHSFSSAVMQAERTSVKKPALFSPKSSLPRSRAREANIGVSFGSSGSFLAGFIVRSHILNAQPANALNIEEDAASQSHWDIAGDFLTPDITMSET
ncbi:hypothetical protein SDC9_125862 [bioreactor metagenome]|uniref:Uncharacterized protein n=1 Tax=bioreactor metagenome TaxID=1076179 RepID=A0A645CPL2_9ZZZZ